MQNLPVYRPHSNFSIFRISNPLNDTEFNLAMHRLEVKRQDAFEDNLDKNERFGLSDELYLLQKNKIADEFNKAKRRLQNDRREAEIIATSFHNGTDPISTAIRETLEMLDRYEEGIRSINQGIKDDVALNMRNITHAVEKSLNSLDQQLERNNDMMKSHTGHYHFGLASALGAMSGIFISFLVFILFKKFKRRNDPGKYTSNSGTLQDSRYFSIDLINSKPAEQLQQIEL